jgi:hypothetical protein
MNPGLRAELLRRMERDQAARRADDLEAFGQIDAENLPWLDKVITEIGWPGRSIVGDDSHGWAGRGIALIATGIPLIAQCGPVRLLQRTRGGSPAGGGRPRRSR